MATRPRPASSTETKRVGTTRHADKVRHAVGNAAQQPVADGSQGLPEGGDWMAEHVESVPAPAPSVPVKRG